MLILWLMLIINAVLFIVCFDFFLSLFFVVSCRSRLAQMLYRLFEDGSSHVEVFVVVARMSKRRMRSLEETTLLSLR